MRCTSAMTTTTTMTTVHRVGCRHLPGPGQHHERPAQGKANGGFAAGTFAVLVGGTANVTLRRPVPLATAVRGRLDAGLVRRRGRAQVVATVERSGPFVLEPPAGPSYAQAEEARRATRSAACATPCPTASSAGLTASAASSATPGLSPATPAMLAAPYDPPAWFSVDGHATHASVWGALDCVSYPATCWPTAGSHCSGR